MVANKADLEHKRQIDATDLQEKSGDMEIKTIETSAESGQNVEKAFYTIIYALLEPCIEIVEIAEQDAMEFSEFDQKIIDSVRSSRAQMSNNDSQRLFLSDRDTTYNNIKSSVLLDKMNQLSACQLTMTRLLSERILKNSEISSSAVLKKTPITA